MGKSTITEACAKGMLRRRESWVESNGARIEHDTQALADRCRRKVVAELGADNTIVAMSSGDTPPHHTILAFFTGWHLLCLLRLVDVRDALAKVEGRIFAILQTVNLNA